MAMFDFLKRKERELPLPPPPMPPGPQGRMQGDFEQIRPPMQQQDMREWQAPQLELEDHHDEAQVPLPPLPPMREMPELEMHDNQDEHDMMPVPAREEEVIFDRTVMREEESQQRASPRFEREPLAKRDIPAKAFVSVNDYKQILNETNMVRQRLMSADSFVKKLQDLRVDEERSLERWRSQLEDVEKKLAYVDQLIEKAQR